MIDGKALRIFLLFMFAMIGSAAWRMSLPDWRFQTDVSAGRDVQDGLILFLSPVCLLTFLVSPLIQWLASPKEFRSSWQRYNGNTIIAWCLFWAFLQAFVLVRSLGLVAMSNLDTARSGSAVIGVIFLMFGNFVPKAPALSWHCSVATDAWRTSRQLRLIGKLFVGLGLAFVLGGVLLPLQYWQPVFSALMLVVLMMGIWFSIKVRRESSL